MNTWRFKSLGDGISSAIDTAEIGEIFRSLFEVAGRPAEMAIFTRQEPGALHCEVAALFSPAAESVALAVGAQPCAPPARQDLKLLDGTTDCWSTLFG